MGNSLLHGHRRGIAVFLWAARGKGTKLSGTCTCTRFRELSSAALAASALSDSRKFHSGIKDSVARSLRHSPFSYVRYIHATISVPGSSIAMRVALTTVLDDNEHAQ